MDGNKIVTFEMFKKYHEQLMGSIGTGDDLAFNIEDIVSEDCDIEEDDKNFKRCNNEVKNKDI